MLESPFGVMALVIAIAVLFLSLGNKFKQPSLIAYLITGVVISFLFPNLSLVKSQDLQIFSSFGIGLLLFITGLGISPETIQKAGKKNLIGGILQVIFTALGAFFLGRFLGMDLITTLILAIGLASSSTIVMLKVFEEKKGMSTAIFAENSLGISISQDVLIMLSLMVILSLQGLGSGGIGDVLGILGMKVAIVVIFVRFSFKHLIPKIIKTIAQSQELLMLFALGRFFIYAAIFEYLGFGMEIGSLLAGMILANSAYKSAVIAKIKSIKDFFIVIFFVLLGANIGPHTQINLYYLLFFSLFILFIKPLIVMMILGFQGSSKKNAFLSGLCFSHISEFSFIAVIFGLENGFITDPNLLGTLTFIALLTIAISGYAIKYSNQIYGLVGKYFSRMPGKGVVCQMDDPQKIQNYDALILGYSAMGKKFRDDLLSAGYAPLVIDWNPHVVEYLNSKGIDSMYGDITNAIFFDTLDLDGLQIVFSGNRHYEDNLIILEAIKKRAYHIKVIVFASKNKDALDFYDKGADYVVLSLDLGSLYTSEVLQQINADLAQLSVLRDQHIQQISDRHTDLLLENLKKK